MIKWILLAVLVVLVALAVTGYILLNERIGEPGSEFKIKVQPSDNAGAVRLKLVEAGARVSRIVYKTLMVYTGADKQIQPGVYRVPSGLTQYQLVEWFKAGHVETSKVTIPEGLTIRATIPILSHGIPTDSSELSQLLADSAFLASFGIGAPGFEGYLFPETYTFFAEEEPRLVIGEMVDMFKSVCDDECRRRAEELGLTLNELVTLASLIEAEGTVGDEYKLISSVFHNRMKMGIMLQCDPTVIYALGGLDRPLLKQDLEFESPYNTYLHYGLPPGPICSPGRLALEAALYPEQTELLYFVADGNGGHIFSETLDEHNRARRSVKRSLRQKR